MSLMMEGKAIVIAGVGTGLGSQVGRLGLREGANVVLAARSRATLESLVINTVDATGAAAFSVGGLAERMRKSAKLTVSLFFIFVWAIRMTSCIVHRGWRFISTSALRRWRPKKAGGKPSRRMRSSRQWNPASSSRTSRSFETSRFTFLMARRFTIQPPPRRRIAASTSSNP